VRAYSATLIDSRPTATDPVRQRSEKPGSHLACDRQWIRNCGFRRDRRRSGAV